MLAHTERIRQGTHNSISPLNYFTYFFLCNNNKTSSLILSVQALDSLQRAQELADGIGNKVSGLPDAGKAELQ